MTYKEVIKKAVEAYCKAWQVSFEETNPFETVEFNENSLVHIEAGIRAALAEQDSEPVAWAVYDILHGGSKTLHWHEQHSFNGNPKQYKAVPLFASQQPAPAVQPLTGWIDPNDKTQAKFLPNIGEPVLFCYQGKVYYGKHNGGGFETGYGVTGKLFGTWYCHWMPIPEAHGITPED